MGIGLLSRAAVTAARQLGRTVAIKPALINSRAIGITPNRGYSVKNNMGIETGVNQLYMRAKVWHGGGEGHLELTLEGDPHVMRFANSFGNMQGGVQDVLHDAAVCALITGDKRGGAHLSKTTNYHRPVPLAGTRNVSVVAQMLDSTYGHAFARTTLKADGVVASTAEHVIRAKPIAGDYNVD